MKTPTTRVPDALSKVGFLLIDSLLDAIYVNYEALHILAYPTLPSEIVTLDDFLSEKILVLLPSDQPSAAEDMKFGRRTYFRRILPVSSHRYDLTLATVILLERKGLIHTDIMESTMRVRLRIRDSSNPATKNFSERLLEIYKNGPEKKH